jgi:hypothetical protein
MKQLRNSTYFLPHFPNCFLPELESSSHIKKRPKFRFKNLTVETKAKLVSEKHTVMPEQEVKGKSTAVLVPY